MPAQVIQKAEEWNLNTSEYASLQILLMAHDSILKYFQTSYFNISATPTLRVNHNRTVKFERSYCLSPSIYD
ncbi:hypothetical protein CapIbe_020211 [Capra ibex]